MKYLTILCLLFSSYGISQSLTTLDKNKGKVKANPVNTADNTLTKITNDLTDNSKQSKNSHMYAIVFKDSDGNHKQKPRFVTEKKGSQWRVLKKELKYKNRGTNIKSACLDYQKNILKDYFTRKQKMVKLNII